LGFTENHILGLFDPSLNQSNLYQLTEDPRTGDIQKVELGFSIPGTRLKVLVGKGNKLVCNKRVYRRVREGEWTIL
jgi:hypothetical protein